MSDLTRTYQTRIFSEIEEPCSEYADLMGYAERCLFADLASGKKINDLKSSYLIRFGLTARQFNAVRVNLEGKISSIQKRNRLLIARKKETIKALETKIKKLKSKKIIHQKKRRLARLQGGLKKLEEAISSGKVSLCFGCKKLFHSQFNLAANRYASHEEWKLDWQQNRKSEIFILGSKDETAGNQSATATINTDGSFNIRIRMPDALAQKFGKYLILPNIRFAYGHEALTEALLDAKIRKDLFLLRDPSYSKHGRAITFRLKKDAKGWLLFASTELKPPAWITKKELGVIGVDINADHLAVLETDRFGNPLQALTIPLPIHGKTKHQIRAIIGDASAKVIQLCFTTKKPLVLENLDFQKKKSSLREEKNSYARMLSSFAYQNILTHLKAKGASKGIQVQTVNPAFSSLIGRVKFAKRYGLSIHHAAALSIGRRFLGVSERMPQGRKEIPDGKGGHVTLDLPVRNRSKHVWHQWGQLNRRLQAALTAHFRTGITRSSSPPRTAPVMATPSDLTSEIPVRESLAQLLC
ncbi:MAG: IS200/IS605 family element transposase accessory protein TnpB [Chlamydiae bacterium]|nr:IS200/IS605 family element transposase accessory protein TnpB [Chlamydiota bacterium]